MKNLHKQIILAAAVVLLGVFSWWFLKYVFYVGNLTLGCWISGIILLIVWGVALCLAMLLIDDKRILYGSFAVFLALFFIFFNNQPYYYLASLILLFLTFLSASWRIRKEEKNQINLNFWKIWKKGLPILATALALIIAVIFYFSPSLIKMRELRIELPRSAFSLVIKPLEGLIKEYLPLGVDLDTDNLYKSINSQINNKLNPYKKFIPLSLALGLFMGLKIVSIAYVAIVILLSWLVVKLLMVVGFVKQEVIKKEAETIKL